MSDTEIRNSKKAAAFALVQSHRSRFMSLAMTTFGGEHRFTVKRKRRRVAPKPVPRTLDSMAKLCALAGKTDSSWWLHTDAVWARAARLEVLA